MDIVLPSGKTIKGIPDGTPKDVIMQKAISAGLATEQDFGIQSKQKQPSEITPSQVGRSFGQGFMLGTSDEVGSALAAGAATVAGALGAPVEKDVNTGKELSIGQIYSGMKGDINEQEKQFAEENPALDFLLQLGGGIASMAAAPNVIGGKALTAKLGQYAPEFVSAASSQVIPRAVVGAVEALPASAIYGAGAAKEGERISGAVTGALTGAGVGFGMPFLTEGLKRGFMLAKNQITRGAGEKAEQIVGSLMRRLNMTREEIYDVIGKMGNMGTLADVDEGLARTGKIAAGGDIANLSKVTKQLDERYLKERPELMNALLRDAKAGDKDDIFAALDAVDNYKREQSSPLYKKAMEENKLNLDNPKAQIVLSSPIVKEAMEAAKQYADDPENYFYFSKTGEVNLQNLNLTEKLHLAKQALWDMEESARNKDRTKNKAGIYARWRKAVTDVLDTNDNYRQAREIYADSSDIQAAAQFGADAMDRGIPYSDFSRTAKDLTPSQLQMARLNFIKAYNDKVGATALSDFDGAVGGRSVAGMVTDIPDIRQKATLLFGSMDNFESAVHKFKLFQRTRNITKGGSPTQLNQDTQGQLENTISKATSFIEDIKGDSKIGTIVNALRYLSNPAQRATPETKRAVSDLLYREGADKALVDRLLSDPQRFLPQYETILRRYEKPVAAVAAGETVKE